MFGVQHPPREQHEAAAGAGIVITFFNVSLKHPSFLLVGKRPQRGRTVVRGGAGGGVWGGFFFPDCNFLCMDVKP